MSQEQQFLSPEDQATLFQKMKDAGMLSQDVGQPVAASNDTSDSDNQQGVGNVDFNTLQSLIKHASNPNSVPMQEGDKQHPMDAIQQIGQKMFGPQTPSGVNKATGPQIMANAPANGILPRLLGMTTPGNSIQVPADGLIPRLLGMKQNIPANGPNYYAAAKAAGIDKFLPDGLAQTADGTPFVGPDTFTHALTAHRVVLGQGNDVYTSKDQLLSQGVPEDVAHRLMAANPTGVTNKEVTNYMGSERIQSASVMANARATMAGVAKLGQALKVGGFDAAQPMAEQAGKNLLLVAKAQPLIDQIVSQGGTANIRQQNELAANIATLAGSGSQLTDQRMDEFMPQTAMKKYGGWKEYFMNQQEPVDFTGFLPQLQDLLTREKQANQGVMSAASQLGLNIMSGTGQPNTANTIAAARAKTPVVSNPPPASGEWKVIR